MTDLTTLVQHYAVDRRDSVAFCFRTDREEKQLTYGELHRRVQAIAHWLQSNNLVGKPVLLAYPAGLEFVEAFLGCLTAGTIPIPVPLPGTRQERLRLSRVADDAQAAYLLGCSSGKSSLEELSTHIPLQWTDELSSHHEIRFANPRPEQVAFVQYTSGSTSLPRGVVVTHANLIANLRQIGTAFGVDANPTCVTWLPHYHDMGLIGSLLEPFFQGCRTIVLSPRSFLKRPAAWLEAISSAEMAISGGPTFAFQHCVDRVTESELASLDLNRWKVAFVGAEPVRSEVLERFVEKFSPCGFAAEAFLPCYGMAEATLMVSGTLRDEPPRIKLHPSHGRRQLVVSCGPPVAETNIRILDPVTQQPLADGREGEVWISGPQVAQQYWNPSSGNGELNRITTGPEAGSLQTGDLGLMWEGDLYITGRKKDLIIVRGENYHPQDLEAVMADACPVLQAAVAASVGGHGAPEQLLIVGEVRRRDMQHHDPQSLLATIREAIWQEYGLTPSYMYLVPSGAIPRTSSGKLQRRYCVEEALNSHLEVLGYWEQQETSTPTAEATTSGLIPTRTQEELEQWLASYLASQLGLEAEEIDVDTPFADWGVDSSVAVSAVCELERGFSTQLDPTLFWEYPTIRQLSKYLLESQKQGTPSSQSIR